MSIPYWPTTLPQEAMPGFRLAPQDVKATFEAATGEPISRPRTTSAPFMGRAQFTFQDGEIAVFEAFYADTLAQGSRRFVWRDPVSDVLRFWRFMGAYDRQFVVDRVARVEADLMLLPGVPWFAPYGLDGLSTVPAFVADYENDVYGIDGQRVPASDLPTIEGTFDVARTVSGTTTATEEALVAGDITETAPLNTTLIVGYPV